MGTKLCGRSLNDKEGQSQSVLTCVEMDETRNGYVNASGLRSSNVETQDDGMHSGWDSVQGDTE